MPKVTGAENIANPDPIYAYKRSGFELVLYPNRVVMRKAGFMFMTKEEAIPLRNIASVEVRRGSATLRITTNDGKKHSYIIGTEAAQVRDAIMSQL